MQVILFFGKGGKASKLYSYKSHEVTTNAKWKSQQRCPPQEPQDRNLKTIIEERLTPKQFQKIIYFGRLHHTSTSYRRSIDYYHF